MARKLSHHKDMWTGFGQFYFKNDRFESARKLLQRCLKCFDKRFRKLYPNIHSRVLYYKYLSSAFRKAGDIKNSFVRLSVLCPSVTKL